MFPKKLYKILGCPPLSLSISTTIFWETCWCMGKGIIQSVLHAKGGWDLNQEMNNKMDTDMLVIFSLKLNWTNTNYFFHGPDNKTVLDIKAKRQNSSGLLSNLLCLSLINIVCSQTSRDNTDPKFYLFTYSNKRGVFGVKFKWELRWDWVEIWSLGHLVICAWNNRGVWIDGIQIGVYI